MMKLSKIKSANCAPAVPESSCLTQWSKVNFSYVWMLEDFCSTWEFMGKQIASAKFSQMTAKGETIWSLTLLPKSDNDEEYVSVFLNLEDCEVSNVYAKFDLTIPNPKTQMFQPARHFTKGETRSWGFEKFVRRDGLLKGALLTQGNVILHCQITIFEGMVNLSDKPKSSSPFKIYWSRFLYDFTELHRSKMLSDVNIVSRTMTFKAHKVILATRSRVFAELLVDLNGLDDQSSLLIPDVDDEVMSEMLHYIYTGQYTQRVKDMSLELLPAAERFALDGLKHMCEDASWNKLTAENSVRTFCVAYQNNAEQLKLETIKFIRDNIAKVLETTDFSTFTNTHPWLMSELLGLIKK